MHAEHYVIFIKKFQRCTLSETVNEFRSLLFHYTFFTVLNTRCLRFELCLWLTLNHLINLASFHLIRIIIPHASLQVSMPTKQVKLRY